MILSQYKIKLAPDFDMEQIRLRIKNNGFKTDGFDDLIYKLYLIAEKDDREVFENEYSPLYLWNSHSGLNKFLFEGFYDNIINSFGNQQVLINIPQQIDNCCDIAKANWVVEVSYSIRCEEKLEKPQFSLRADTALAKVLAYNPDKWIATEYYFYQTKPDVAEGQLIYQVLHISK